MKTPEQFPVQEPENQERVVTPDLVETSLSKDFGFEMSEIEKLRSDEQGQNSIVFTGIHEGQKVIAKFGERPLDAHVEFLGSRLLRDHGIPTPKALLFSEKVKGIERPILVQEAARGTSLRQSQDKNPKLWKDAGRVLSRIHQIKVDGFGSFKVENEKLKGEEDQLKVFKPDFTRLVTLGHLDERERNELEKVFSEIESIDMPQASFLHNDYHSGHIFTDGDTVSDIIDLGGSFAGDPRRDIAVVRYSMLSTSPSNIEVFNRGYGKLANDPVVSRYFVLIAARKLLRYTSRKGLEDDIPEAVSKLKTALAERAAV